jgi:hypothetical protein
LHGRLKAMRDDQVTATRQSASQPPLGTEEAPWHRTEQAAYFRIRISEDNPMFFRAYFPVFALVLGTSCRINGPVVGQTAENRGSARDPVLASEVTLQVTTKRAPDALIAPDGSSCRVSPDVYASTRVGSLFRCRWLRN